MRAEPICADMHNTHGVLAEETLFTVMHVAVVAVATMARSWIDADGWLPPWLTRRGGRPDDQ